MKKTFLVVAALFLAPCVHAEQTGASPVKQYSRTKLGTDDGEAGYKVGAALYNSTIGKANPIPETPSGIDRLHEAAREAGRRAAERYSPPVLSPSPSSAPVVRPAR